MRVVSIFSGIGGLDEGFRQAGFTIVAAYDQHPAAVQTLSSLYPSLPVFQRDLRDGIADHHADGLIGGPPCQPFSRANQQKTAIDARSDLVLTFFSIVRDYAFSFFVFENVATFIRDPRYALVLQQARDAGFFVSSALVRSSDYEVPQVRRRLFIVGHKRKPYVFPNPQPRLVTPYDVLHHLPEPAFYPQQSPYHPNHVTSRTTSDSVLHALRHGTYQRTNLFSIVIRPDNPCPALTRYPYIHYNQQRRLSVLEMLLLQTFPESYRIFGGLRTQQQFAANAVPVRLSYWIAHQLAQL